MKEVIKLSQIALGKICSVTTIQNDNLEFRRRLLDMGLTRGTKVMVKKTTPLGDPIDIELRGYELCIRKCDADKILVETI